MPKFAPNTGFKMPGVGSKNIDSPGNFRDEQHVDKVGYCDTTEDRMLPEGSSPLKVRYASSGYLKDLDAISIPSKKGCPKGYKAVDGKCVKTGDKPPEDKPPENKPKGKTQLKVPERKVDLPDAPSITDVPMLTNKTDKPVVKAKKYIKYSDLPGGSEGAAAKQARKENEASGRGDFASTTGKGGRKDDKSRYTVRENETEAQAKKRKMEESK